MNPRLWYINFKPLISAMLIFKFWIPIVFSEYFLLSVAGAGPAETGIANVFGHYVLWYCNLMDWLYGRKITCFFMVACYNGHKNKDSFNIMFYEIRFFPYIAIWRLCDCLKYILHRSFCWSIFICNFFVCLTIFLLENKNLH